MESNCSTVGKNSKVYILCSKVYILCVLTDINK
uniref:Uncharacterized protein n=1 Tax=Arundo donax TaxID=35708 RepID=A0A0A9H6J7_ARUDO